MKEAFKIRRN